MACDLLQLNGILRVAVCLIRGVEFKVTGKSATRTPTGSPMIARVHVLQQTIKSRAWCPAEKVLYISKHQMLNMHSGRLLGKSLWLTPSHAGTWGLPPYAYYMFFNMIALAYIYVKAWQQIGLGVVPA